MWPEEEDSVDWDLTPTDDEMDHGSPDSGLLLTNLHAMDGTCLDTSIVSVDGNWLVSLDDDVFSDLTLALDQRIVGLKELLGKIRGGIGNQDSGNADPTLDELEAQLKDVRKDLYDAVKKIAQRINADSQLRGIKGLSRVQPLQRRLGLSADRNRARHALDGSLILLERNVAEPEMEVVKPLVDTVRRDYEDFWSLTRRVEELCYLWISEKKRLIRRYRDQRDELNDRWKYFQLLTENSNLLDKLEAGPPEELRAALFADYKLATEQFEKSLDHLEDEEISPTLEVPEDIWDTSDDSFSEEDELESEAGSQDERDQGVQDQSQAEDQRQFMVVQYQDKEEDDEAQDKPQDTAWDAQEAVPDEEAQEPSQEENQESPKESLEQQPHIPSFLEFRHKFHVQVERLRGYVCDDAYLSQTESELLRGQIKTFENQVVQLTQNRDLLENQLKDERVTYETRMHESDHALRKALDAVPKIDREDGTAAVLVGPDVIQRMKDCESRMEGMKDYESQLEEARVVIETQTGHIVQVCDERDRYKAENAELSKRILEQETHKKAVDNVFDEEIGSMDELFEDDEDGEDDAPTQDSIGPLVDTRFQLLELEKSELETRLAEKLSTIANLEGSNERLWELLLEANNAKEQPREDATAIADENVILEKNTEIEALQAQVELLSTQIYGANAKADDDTNREKGTDSTMNILKAHKQLLEEELAAHKADANDAADYLRAKMDILAGRAREANLPMTISPGTLLSDIEAFMEHFELMHHEHEVLKIENATVQAELDKMKELAQTYKGKIDDLQLQDQEEPLDMEADGLRNEIDNLKKLVHTQETNIDDLQNAVEAANQQVVETQASNTSAEHERDELRAQVKSLSEKEASLEQDALKLESEITHLQVSLEEAKTDLNASRAQAAVAERELHDAKIQHEAAQTATHGAEDEKLEEIEAELYEVRRLLVSTQNQLADAKASNHEAVDSKLDDLQAELDEVRELLEITKTQLAEAQKGIEGAEDEKSEKLQAGIEELREIGEATKQQLAEAEALAQGAQDEKMENFQADFNAVQALLDSTKEKLLKAEAINETGKEILEIVKVDRDYYRSELERVRLQLEQMERGAEADLALDQPGRAQAETIPIEALRDAWMELETTDLESTQVELEDAKQELKSCRRELEQTKILLEISQADLEETKELLDSCRKELEQTKQHLESARSDLAATRSSDGLAEVTLRTDLEQAQKLLEATKKELEHTRKNAMVPSPDSLQTEVFELKKKLVKAQEALKKERDIPFEEHRARHVAAMEEAAKARRLKDMGKGRRKRTADQLAAEEAEKIVYSLDSKRARRATRHVSTEPDSDTEYQPPTPASTSSSELSEVGSLVVSNEQVVETQEEES